MSKVEELEKSLKEIALILATKGLMAGYPLTGTDLDFKFWTILTLIEEIKNEQN